MNTKVDFLAKSNKELWELALNGDREAYAVLVLRYAPQMRASLRAVVIRSRHWTRTRRDDVADLLQELHVMLLSRGPAFLGRNGTCQDIEWVFRVVASRAARSYLRSGRRSAWAELPCVDEVETLAATERTEEALLARDRLRRAFGGGDARVQQIVHALYVEGRSLDEVCACWHVTRNSIYCAAKRFRAHVRALETREGRR